MKEFKSKWVDLSPYKGFCFTFELGGYFEPTARFNIQLFFFMLIIRLPINTKWDECDPPRYGLAIHSGTFWVYIGGDGNWGNKKKWISWSIPFFTKNWVRTSILLKDGTWEHETPKDKKEFYADFWKEKRMTWSYDYTDSFDGEIIPTKIYVDEREWRPKWLTWTSLFKMTRKTIDIEFSKEVGKKKGSYKGGCIGCSYDINPKETPLDCLKRMESERKF